MLKNIIKFEGFRSIWVFNLFGTVYISGVDLRTVVFGVIDINA